MKGVIKKTVLSALNRTINILEKEHDENVEQLRILSNYYIKLIEL